jgi:hypothetical protein
MPKACPNDLRERVVRAVDAGILAVRRRFVSVCGDQMDGTVRRHGDVSPVPRAAGSVPHFIHGGSSLASAGFGAERPCINPLTIK